MNSRVLIPATVVVFARVLFAAPAPAENPATQAILGQYLAATRAGQATLRDMSMEVDIDAKLPNLSKSGKLNALRHISRLGQITYRRLTFQGDNTVKKDLIARYLEAEAKAAPGSSSMAITPDNYKFRYRGVYGSGDWKLHLFELTPRAKRVGLFKGWLWLEAQSCRPVREQGRFVKTPSIFLKRVEFVRDYMFRDGVAIPVRIDSSIETRLVGRAELSVRFSKFEHEAQPAGEVSALGDTNGR